jgi:hypothetical protein
MKSSIILFCIFVLFCQAAVSQTSAKITDVDFYFQNNQIIVNYKIEGSFHTEMMTISLKFITEINQEIIPKTTMGDIGENISGNGTKIIIWDVSKDIQELSGVLKASVKITETKITYRGSQYALLSVLVPGLGGYFTDNHKTRAGLTTISTLGLMTYGITQKTQANKYYKNYKASKSSEEMQTQYDLANRAQHNYYIATRVGAAIWMADIVWVTVKGIRNKKEINSYRETDINDGLKLNYVNNRLQLGYQITF